jgi:hypothetical protein
MYITDYTNEQLKAELKRREEVKKISQLPKIAINNPVSIWKVTTEGDCEGRSTKELGIFKGHIVDIALSLADKSYYTLNFKETEHPKETLELPKSNKVNVVISDTHYRFKYDFKPKERVIVATEFLQRSTPNNSYKINESSYWESVQIEKL